MDLADAPFLDDPVERIFAYHRRAERQLAALGRLPVHLELHGVDSAASAIAAGALACFGPAMVAHHHDQERELLPLLCLRVARGADAAQLAPLRQRIEGDHRELGRAWRELRRPLDAVAEGLPRTLPPIPLGHFRVLFSLHISMEEGALHALAQRYLQAADREALARRLRARRAATKRSSH
jgi:hypothetical protein